jgi:glutamate decarboxylase
MCSLTHIADYLSACLAQMGFIIMSKTSGAGLPLVAFRIDPKKGKHYDEFAIAHQLRSRSWVLPAYTMAPHSENLKLLRIVVREDLCKSRCDLLINDIRLCIGILDDMDKKEVETFVSKHTTRSGRASHNHPRYKHEKHSLQGKTGKTHAIC